MDQRIHTFESGVKILMNRCIALFIISTFAFVRCVFNDNNSGTDQEKSFYLYTGEISDKEFVINKDTSTKCYRLKVERRIPIGGTAQSGSYLDTLDINSCDAFALYTKVLDTLAQELTKHSLVGTFVVKWAKPSNDSGWVKELKINGDNSQRIYSHEFIRSQLNLYTTFDYFGDMINYKTPSYFDSVNYSITLTKPDV